MELATQQKEIEEDIRESREGPDLEGTHNELSSDEDENTGNNEPESARSQPQ